MKLKLIASMALVCAVVSVAVADIKLKSYRTQDDETLGPVQGAKSISAGGLVVWADGDRFGTIALTYGVFASRNVEPYITFAWAFNNVSGSSGDSILYGLGVRYHFIGDAASRTIPYLLAEVGGAEPDEGDSFSYWKVGGGANFFMGPQRAFYVAIFQTFFSESFLDDTTTMEVGMRIFTK